MVTEWILGGEPNSPWTYFAMRLWLKGRLHPDDIFHAPYRILPQGLPCKSVMTIHDVMQIVCPELVFPNPLQRAIAQPYWNMAIRGSLRRADRILAVSQHSADDVRRVDPSCAPRIRVSPLGKSASFHKIDTAKAQLLVSSIVPSGQRFFLVLGGGYPNKNHTAAVSAFAKYSRHTDPIQMLVIQRNRFLPPELGKILRDVPKGLIQIRPGVSLKELVALYSLAEALVFPSLYEGFGLPLLEAMACGCPVICSNVTSLPEVAGDAALYVPPNDESALAQAMQRVAEDPLLRKSLSERGLRRVAQFEWRNTALATVASYREVAPSLATAWPAYDATVP